MRRGQEVARQGQGHGRKGPWLELLARRWKGSGRLQWGMARAGARPGKHLPGAGARLGGAMAGASCIAEEDALAAGQGAWPGAEPGFEHRGAVQPRTIMCVKILHDKDVHSTKINVCAAVKKQKN